MLNLLQFKLWLVWSLLILSMHSIKQDMRLHINLGDSAVTKGSLNPLISNKLDSGDCETFYLPSPSTTLATINNQLKPPSLKYAFIILNANFVDFIYNSESSATFTVEVTDGTTRSIFKTEEFYQFDQDASTLSFGALSKKTVRRNHIGTFSFKVEAYNPDKLIVNIQINNGTSQFYIKALEVYYSTCDLYCNECDDSTRQCTTCETNAELSGPKCACTSNHHQKITTFSRDQSTKLECVDPGADDPCASYDKKGNMEVCTKCRESFVLSNNFLMWQEQSNFPSACKCPPLTSLVEGKCEHISYADCKAETLWFPKPVINYIDRYVNDFKVNVELKIEPITRQSYYAETFVFPPTDSVDKRLMSFGLLYNVNSNERRTNVYSYGSWTTPEGLFFNQLDIDDISDCTFVAQSEGQKVTRCNSFIYIFNTCTKGVYAKGSQVIDIVENSFVSASFNFNFKNNLI